MGQLVHFNDLNVVQIDWSCIYLVYETYAMEIAFKILKFSAFLVVIILYVKMHIRMYLYSS